MKRVVAITGVAGGIGRATVRVFRDAGWQVVGIDRRKPDDATEVDRFIQADIAETDAPHHVFESVIAREGQLDALVNNAALQICKPIVETSAEDWDSVLACNVRAVFLSMKQSYTLLKKCGGAIVNVSSVHAVATSCGIAAYAASKGALLALTRAGAGVWAGRGACECGAAGCGGYADASRGARPRARARRYHRKARPRAGEKARDGARRKTAGDRADDPFPCGFGPIVVYDWAGVNCGWRGDARLSTE